MSWVDWVSSFASLLAFGFLIVSVFIGAKATTKSGRIKLIVARLIALAVIVWWLARAAFGAGV